jgi:hypothetical protein
MPPPPLLEWKPIASALVIAAIAGATPIAWRLLGGPRWLKRLEDRREAKVALRVAENEPFECRRCFKEVPTWAIVGPRHRRQWEAPTIDKDGNVRVGRDLTMCWVCAGISPVYPKPSPRPDGFQVMARSRKGAVSWDEAHLAEPLEVTARERLPPYIEVENVDQHRSAAVVLQDQRLR